VVSFATKVPGHIVQVEVSPGSEYMIHRHGLVVKENQGLLAEQVRDSPLLLDSDVVADQIECGYCGHGWVSSTPEE
jgi:hypothetical protein